MQSVTTTLTRSDRTVSQEVRSIRVDHERNNNFTGLCFGNTMHVAFPHLKSSSSHILITNPVFALRTSTKRPSTLSAIESSLTTVYAVYQRVSHVFYLDHGLGVRSMPRGSGAVVGSALCEGGQRIVTKALIHNNPLHTPTTTVCQ